MKPSHAQRALEAGEALTGSFCPISADLATAGVLRWSPTTGAELRLADLADPWPRKFNTHYTIHGQLHVGERITLLDGRLAETTALNQASRYLSATLALGEHTHPGETWTYAHYSPTGLHEWYPQQGFIHGESEDDPPRPRLQMRPVKPLRIPAPGAEISLALDGDWRASISPNWSIETMMRFIVKAEEPLTIDEHWNKYRSPLLGFIIFATDRPDDLRWESFYNPDTKRQIALLREDRETYDREWRLTPGHLLFRAEDLDDIGAAIRAWLELWRTSAPSLGLFCETVQQGSMYSPPRFLTLYTSAEGYWRATKRPAEKNWKIDALATRANIDPSVTHADKKARRLIGALRDYHAHLTLPVALSIDDIAGSTFDSTRRLHTLMQACLLREIGLNTSQVEQLLAAHYRGWPIPSSDASS